MFDDLRRPLPTVHTIIYLFFLFFLFLLLFMLVLFLLSPLSFFLWIGNTFFRCTTCFSVDAYICILYFCIFSCGILPLQIFL